MKVAIDGKEYAIQFRYDVVVPYVGKALGIRQRTTCQILDMTGWKQGDGDPPVVAAAEVVRYFRDKESRELGRKYALKKAIDQLVPKSHGRESLIERRRAFWLAYLGRKHTQAQNAAKQ